MLFNLIFITFSFKLFVKKLQSLGFALHFYNQSNGEQSFCSLSAHQHSPDQMKIAKNQSGETMAIYIHMLLWYICYSDSMFFLYLKVLLFIIIFIHKHYYLFRYYFIISFIVIINKYIIYQFSLFHYCNYLPLFTIVTSYILTLYWVQIWFSFCHCFLP